MAQDFILEGLKLEVRFTFKTQVPARGQYSSAILQDSCFWRSLSCTPTVDGSKPEGNDEIGIVPGEQPSPSGCNFTKMEEPDHQGRLLIVSSSQWCVLWPTWSMKCHIYQNLESLKGGATESCWHLNPMCGSMKCPLFQKSGEFERRCYWGLLALNSCVWFQQFLQEPLLKEDHIQSV